jgi:hypothetical protein
METTITPAQALNMLWILRFADQLAKYGETIAPALRNNIAAVSLN